MQKKITAQTVIEYVYMLFRKRRALDEDIRREVNKLIVKCNAHLCSEGDNGKISIRATVSGSVRLG